MTPREQRDARVVAERLANARPVTRAERTAQSRRGFLGFAAGAAAVTGGWLWVQSRPPVDRIPPLTRAAFEFNDRVWSTLVDPGQMAPEFTLADARPIPTNGTLGLDTDIDLASWTLRVEGTDGRLIDEWTIQDVTYDSVAGVPAQDRVYEHKCIEGWANITHFRGATFAEVMAERYERQIARARFVALETPDRGYYVGLDMDTAMHPQTLLAGGQEGAVLEQVHGAPLRLVTPIHYGIKSLKRIGVIRFALERPPDYWAERGYDWHSTH